MPQKMEQALRREALKRRLSGKKKDAFIYGTMRKTGWTPSTQRSANDNNSNP